MTGIGIWLFPLAATRTNTWRGHLHNAALLALGHLPQTLQILAYWIVPLIFTIAFQTILKYFGWLWLLCGISGIMALSARVLRGKLS